MPKFFVSYVRDDNRHGRIQKIMDELCAELKTHREASTYFIDVDSYDHARFPERILSELKSSDFLVVFLTPLYLTKPYTQAEYLTFLDIEREYGDNRIIVLYYVKIENFRDTHFPYFLLEDLRSRNGFNWLSLRNKDVTDPDHLEAITKLCISVRSKLPHDETDVIPLTVDHDIKFNTLIPNVLDEVLTKISQQLHETKFHIAFRSHLIEGILSDISSELDSLNNSEYRHNISLNKNFVTRAAPLFNTAAEIYAISIDAFSSFWISEAALAERYLRMQPKRTYRMFVFSDQRSMLKHRWVLAAHYDGYGKCDGRVLFTNRDTWDNFLREISTDADEVDKSRIHNRLSADFGLLVFNPLQRSYYEAVLSHESLSFSEVSLSNVHRRIIDVFNSSPNDIQVKLGNAGMAMAWQPEYRDDDKWYQAVAEIFHKRSLEQEEVVHIVLFSANIMKDVFQQYIDSVLPKLIEMVGSNGEKLIKGHWYGSRMMYIDNEPRDPMRGIPLLVENELSDRWPHCMILYFSSPHELEEYYRHPVHSKLRTQLYKQFSPRIDKLFGGLDNENIGAKERNLIGEAIETLVSEYMRRLDLVKPTLYANYKLIEAPSFAGWGST